MYDGNKKFDENGAIDYECLQVSLFFFFFSSFFLNLF